MKASTVTRAAATALIALAFGATAGTPGTANAANGQCKYGQKRDGTCWDSQATASATNTYPNGALVDNGTAN